MAKTIYVHDKARIERVLRRAPILHMFGLGDLDDFYWPYTNWYALVDNNEIQQLILTYIDAPNLRQGVATAVTARLCQSLKKTVDHIGLLVHADNDGAIACYAGLGFVQHSTVEAYSLERR